jgi:Tol biopolymer transport system component
MKVAISGGPPQMLTPAAWEAGTSWSADGVMLFAQPTPQGIAIHRVSDDGGEPSPVTTVDPEREIGHFWPHFLPDGRRFLYLCLEKSTGERPVRTLYLASLDGGTRRPIPDVASRAQYVAPGLLVFAADGVLLARPFDIDRAEFTGDAVMLTRPVRYFRMTGQSEFSLSQGSSRSVLAVHGGPWRSELVLYDRAGARQKAIGTPAAYHQLSVSRDGSQLVVAVLDPTNGGRDLWVHEIDGSRARRLTLNPPDEQSPVWSPDDARIAFRSDVMGPPDLYVQDASGRGEPTTLLRRPTVLEPEDWSRDAGLLLFRVSSRATGQDQWLLPLDGRTQPRALLDTRYSEWGGRFSPDGRWIAFVSDESGRNEVYVAPLGDPGARRALSTAGGISPRWRADGREIYYLGPRNTVMAVSVTGDQISIGEPQELFAVNSPVYGAAFDITPDGQRFVLNQVLDDVSQSPVRVTINWTQQLAAPAVPPTP